MPLDDLAQATAAGEPAPDLMGYASVEELVKAKRASDQEVKRLAHGQQALEQRLAQVEQSVRPPVPQRSGRPQDRLAELGIPADAVEEIVQERIGQAFQPLAQMMQARTQLAGQYPEFSKFESEVAQFIAADPELEQRYNRMFQSDPVGALEYGLLKFSEDRRAHHKAVPQRGREPAEVADAAIPSSRSGDARRAPAGPDQARLDELANRFRQTGSRSDAEAYAKARLRGIIKDDFLTA